MQIDIPSIFPNITLESIHHYFSFFPVPNYNFVISILSITTLALNLHSSIASILNNAKEVAREEARLKEEAQVKRTRNKEELERILGLQRDHNLANRTKHNYLYIGYPKDRQLYNKPHLLIIFNSVIRRANGPGYIVKNNEKVYEVNLTTNIPRKLARSNVTLVCVVQNTFNGGRGRGI
jgi:hypothetical protein